MRISAWRLVARGAVRAPAASAPAVRRHGPVGTMSDLMVKIIYPASDAIFYITTRTPTTDAEWNELQGKALDGRRVGEPADDAGPRPRPGPVDGRCEADARRRPRGLSGRAGERRRALDEVNDALYQSCTSCHQHYRPDYGRRPLAAGTTDGPGGAGGSNGASTPANSVNPIAAATPAAGTY